jgi:hypothetical protein
MVVGPFLPHATVKADHTLLQGVPLVTQSDPGSENFGVANAQTVIRHRLDPSLSDTLQHRWMIKHQNILSEIKWSMFRRDWTPGFEAILDDGVNQGWYDVNNVLEMYVVILASLISSDQWSV